MHIINNETASKIWLYKHVYVIVILRRMFFFFIKDSMKELQSVNGINDVKENGKHFSSETESFIGSKSGKNVVHEYETKQEGKSCVGCSSICIGWRVYAAQIVVFAGVSLSLLYMTVLGFDGITTGNEMFSYF